MKKTLFFVAVLLIPAFISPVHAHAQMMEGMGNTSDDAKTAREEAEGKAVWDRLQDKQVTCRDLTDEDFDVLGDFFMGNMMGSNHDSMNRMMEQRLGDEGEEQMHVAMGKRLSGCDTNAALPQGADYFSPMMGGGAMMGNTKTAPWAGVKGMTGYSAGTGMGLLGSLIGIALLTFLLSGSIYFWKALQKKK